MAEPIATLQALYTTGTLPELAVYNHNLRIDAVIGALTVNNIRSVVDLGSGDGSNFYLNFCTFSGHSIDLN